ncbi:expressed unknown protein [Seminavis robusta]|uniref:Uncharacterized protein n=1 Tax=Seminavis robusta TaxID=568900 RepID=A0A9N8H2D0_9STRA|nr:expressed unknown protein [Seminavis robusta]|eukprot:Sro62_g035450.1 n/a (372) ;mRNA; r:94012-95127
MNHSMNLSFNEDGSVLTASSGMTAKHGNGRVAASIHKNTARTIACTEHSMFSNDSASSFCSDGYLFEDSNSSLLLDIPSQDKPEEEIDACIHYMGRNYEASDFRSSAPVLEQSFRNARNNDSLLNQGGSMHNLLSRWGRGNSNNSVSHNLAASTTSMGLGASEHIADRWAKLEDDSQEQQHQAPPLSSSPPTSTSGEEQLTLQQQQRRANRRKATRTATTPPSAARQGLPPKSNSSSNLMLQRNSYHTPLSRSSNHGGGSHSQLQLMSAHSEHTALSTRSIMKNETFISKVFGSSLTPEEKEQQQWSQRGLEKWGYTNADVASIIEDDETFAKLKRNLRNRNAVTNSLVVQRLHVFVKSQKQKQQREQEQQ